MTHHIYVDYRCSGCYEPYIPFSEEQKACPRCGIEAPEVKNIVAEAVESAKEPEAAENDQETSETI